MKFSVVSSPSLTLISTRDLSLFDLFLSSSKFLHSPNITSPYLRSPRELGQGVRVGDEGESCAAPYDLLDINPKVVCRVTQDAEDGDPSEHGSKGINHTDNPSISGEENDCFSIRH